MGFKEGWQQGRRVAETIYRVSRNFQDAHDPELDRRLELEGVTPKDIKRLTIRPTLSLTEIGYIVRGVTFLARHGTIWNSADMRKHSGLK